LTKEDIEEKLKNLDIDLMEKEMYERGGFIQEKTKGNAYISATKAICDHLRDWFQGSDRPVSMGVIVPSTMYSVSAGLCFSMPTVCTGGGQYYVIENIKLNEEQVKRFAENQD
jgi:malate/lactate dehydrogenase